MTADAVATGAAAVAGIALSTWTGATVLAAVDGRGSLVGGGALRLALAYLAGAGLTSLVIFVLGLLHVPIAVVPVAGTLAVLGLAAAVIAARRAKRVPAADVLAPRREPADPAARLLLLFAVLLVIAIAVLALAQRAAFVDARAIWMLKARVIFLDGGFDGSYFRDWPDRFDRRGYPPLVPLLGTWMHLLSSRLDDLAAKLPLVLCLPALAAVVHDLLLRRCSRRTAALGAVLLLLSPATLDVTLWGGADLPLAALLLAALHALLPATGPPAIGRASLFLALAAFTKNEGLPAAVLVVLAWCAAGQRATGDPPLTEGSGWRARLPAATRMLAAPVALWLAWDIFLRQRGLSHSGMTVSLHLDTLRERVPMVAQELGRSLVDTGWLYVWPLLGLALLASLRRGTDRSLLPVTLLPPLLIGCYAATFLVLEDYSREVLRGAVERLLYHTFPAALCATLAVLLPSPGARRIDASIKASHAVT